MIKKKKRVYHSPRMDFRIDELTDKQLQVFSENHQLVSLVKNGVSIKDAIKRLEIDRKPRTVRNLVKRFRKYGTKGLIDKRWFGGRRSEVLTDEVKKIILHYYFRYSAAGERLIWNRTRDVCKNRKLPQPSEGSVRKFTAELPRPLKMLRHGIRGEKQWKREAAPYVRYENTKYGNERWQADHAPLPIWIRVKRDDKWIPVEVHITAIMDAHTRSIAGYVISTKYPDSWSIALALLTAFKTKDNPKWKNRGLPFTFQTDRGKDYMSHAIMATLAKLNINFDPDPPYYPNRKGKIERFFLSLDTGCLRILPGHKSAIGKTFGAAIKRVPELLTLGQLKKEVERWVVEEYHQRIHSTTKQKPGPHWVKTARLRMPHNEDDLNLLVLKDDRERTVRNTGVGFAYKGVKRNYWSPELPNAYGLRVRVSYNPEDLESILLHDAATGEFICEAFDMNADTPKYTVNDVREERNRYRLGLKSRMNDYKDEVEADDRRVVREIEDEEQFEMLVADDEAGRLEEFEEALSKDDDYDDILKMLENYQKTLRGE